MAWHRIIMGLQQSRAYLYTTGWTTKDGGGRQEQISPRSSGHEGFLTFIF